jgi:predicted TPR repeat methyltransferase
MLLARHGFQILKTVKSVIRKDGGKPVSGILFLTQKPA